MISRRILAAVALLCAFAAPAYAQKTKAALTTEINANWGDNTTQAITPALLRSTVIDIVNSYYDLNGGTSLSCAAHQWVAALPTLSSVICTQPAIGDLTGLQTGMPAWLASSAGDVLINASGSSVIQPGAVNSSKIAANGVANSNIAPGAANTFKGSLNGSATSDIAFTACTLAYQITKWVNGSGWQCGINPVLPSRAIAATLNLAAFSAITTQGYSQAGDGGAATFQNVSSAQYQDVSIATGNLTSAGSSCTNGTYFGVSLSGGTGTLGMATVVASGAVVSSVTITYAGAQYSAGDVLTGTITGCTFTWTVATITAPSGSFADTSGAHFQIVMPAQGIDIRAFGVKFDWTVAGGDAGATDNFTTITNAYLYAGAQLGGGVFATGGTTGGRVLLPRGMAMYCGSSGAKALSQPYGVAVRGQGNFASGLKPCDAWGTATNMYELCNSQSHLSCFQTMFEDAQIYVAAAHDAGASVATLAVVYSNNCQQENCGLRNAAIFTGACRIGYKLEISYGGGSLVTAADGVQILGGEQAANCATNAALAMSINFGTTSVIIDRLTIGGLSPSFGGDRDDGLGITGGFVDIRQLTAEQVVSPLIVNIPTSLTNGMVTLKNSFGDAGCGWLATLVSTNQPGNFSIEGPMAVNSCAGLVQDNQSGGSNMTVPQVLPKAFAP